MFQIQGSILVVPLAVTTDSGTYSEGEGKPPSPAVIQSFDTLVGRIQVIIPIEHVDQTIEGLKTAKEGAEKETSSDLYIPRSDEEVQQFAQQIGKVNEAPKRGN